MARKKTTDGPQIPAVTWNIAMIWDLVSQIEKPAHLKVLFGIKEDSYDKKTGERKVAVYQAIAQALIPEVASVCLRTAGDCIKKKIEWLKDRYVKLAAKLKQTGGGLKDGESSDIEDGSPDVVMDFYIPPDGPDENTPESARNLFEQLTEQWEFFPNCHRIWATRPNINPPAVTTGVGPNGRKVTWMQPPVIRDEYIDPVLLAQSCAANAALQESYNHEANPDISTPPPPSQSTIPRRHMKTPSISFDAIEKAKASIKRIPQKCSFEDCILDIQSQNVKNMNAHLSEECKIKKRKLLMEEYKLGLWSLVQYRQKVEELEDAAPEVSGGPSSSSQSELTFGRDQSPIWDIEKGSVLPSDD